MEDGGGVEVDVGVELEALPDGVFGLDGDLVHTDVAGQAAQLFGIGLEDLGAGVA